MPIENILEINSNYNKIIENLPDSYSKAESKKLNKGFEKAQKELKEKFKYHPVGYHIKNTKPLYIN